MVPGLMKDPEGFKSSAEEVTADMGRRARDLELEVEPEDVAELLQLHDQTLMKEELLRMEGHGNGFVRWDLLLYRC